MKGMSAGMINRVWSLLAFIFPISVVFGKQKVSISSQVVPLCHTLFVGNDVKDLNDVGNVCAEMTDNNDGELKFTVTLSNPQCTIHEFHICNLPFVSPEGLGVSFYVFTIPAKDVTEFVCDWDDVDHDILAQATVICEERNAHGEITESSHSAYFSVPVTCSTPELAGTVGSGVLTPPEGECETAFAMTLDNDLCHPYRTNNRERNCATCFHHLSEDDVYAKFHRWGWTNGPYESVNQYLSQLGEEQQDIGFDIYASAGECDWMNNGQFVGKAFMDYHSTPGQAKIRVDLVPGWMMMESHLYIGDEILPRSSGESKGNEPGQYNTGDDFTVSPTQYPYIHENLGGGLGTQGENADFYSIDSIGPVYVILHAVVCPVSAPV